MAVKLNLLPQSYAVSDSVAKVLKVVRPLNIILLSLFLVFAMGLAGYFIFSSITIKNLNSENMKLNGQIQSQKKAQQQVVLLKDRLTKIKNVFMKPGATQNISMVEPLLNSLPEGASVSELTIDPQKTNIIFNFQTNSALSDFMSTINSQTVFSSITMESFTYSPLQGYLVGFLLIPSTEQQLQ